MEFHRLLFLLTYINSTRGFHYDNPTYTVYCEQVQPLCFIPLVPHFFKLLGDFMMPSSYVCIHSVFGSSSPPGELLLIGIRNLHCFVHIFSSQSPDAIS
jgi:hypothetical protein